ncbi:MAG: hypothetical protein ACM3JG_20285 [Thiohalocapsa sp.]
MPAGLVHPEIQGTSARELRPALAALLVTAYAHDNAILDPLDVEVLRKPFQLAELGDRVRRLLADAASAQHLSPAHADDG